MHGVKGLDDISLVAQVVVFHNKRAFNALVMKYQSPIRQFFLSHTLGDGQLSDDLAQETFIKAYTHIASFKGLAGFSTWLYRIAYNVMYDYHRAHKVTSGIDSPEMSRRQAASTDSAMKMDIYDALKLLKPDERTCITLQLMDGQSVEKITEITGMAAGTVKSHLSRGKRKLAIYLRENGYDR